MLEMQRMTRKIGIYLLAGMLALAGGAASGLCDTTLKPPPMTMSLSEAIAIALRSNRDVKRAYITRVLNKFSLKVAEAEFGPDINLNLSTSPSVTETRTETEDVPEESKTSVYTYGQNSALTVDKALEYGGTLNFSWARDDALSDSTGSSETYKGTNTWTAKFTQPLLKGFGKEVTTQNLVSARLAEQENLLALRDSIGSVVNSTISAFRSYAQAVRQVEISKASVERSRALLEKNKLLISMGRLASNELIQSEADLANQELSYESTLNSLDNARTSLLKVLNLDQDTLVNVVEESDFTPIHPDMDRCLEMAYENRLDYLSSKHAVRLAQIGVTVAKDAMKWSLDFESSYKLTDTNNRGSANTDEGVWSAGVALKVPIRVYGKTKLGLEQSLLSAQSSLTNAKLSLADRERDIRLDLKDAIREVETSIKQLGMAVRARELSERQLEVEKEKLAVGRSTNFQLVTYQNDLVSSQQSELSAKVSYLNALTALDTFLGTTLSTWKIDYNKEFDKWPGK